jgi:hypothetical protein
MTDAGNDTSVQSAPRPAAPVPGATCGNCGTPLLGPHCHACGQPVTGLVRHFSSLVGDFLDSVFDLDSRTPRTLWPLFARPGHLSIEYFAGRRVRYVSPVRLFFFLAIVTFFVAQLLLSFGDAVIIETDTPQADAVAQAMTVDEVRTRRDAALLEAREARRGKQPAVGPDPALVALEVDYAPAQKNGAGLIQRVGIHTEELLRQLVLFDAVMVVQTGLCAPADVQRGMNMGLAPFHNLTKLFPIVYLFEFHLFNRCTGNNHTVILFMFDFIKCLIEVD